MIKRHLLSSMLLLFAYSIYGQQNVTLVNPFIGSANSGNTNPGAVMPWGMVSISPFTTWDTATATAAATPYQYGNKYIYGFTHINMSGVGCGDLGTFCLMPVTGAMHAGELYKSEYSGEQASPGYYSVFLDRYKTKVELSATTRSAISCYTFPKGQSNIVLNMAMGLTTKKGAMIKQVSSTEVEGYKNIGGLCGLKTAQTVYFIMKCSKDPLQSGVWNGKEIIKGPQQQITGDSTGAFFSFETLEGEKIYIKTGISYVSIQNARQNLEAEQPGFDLEGTRLAASTAWEIALSKIQVEGGKADDRIKFYTAIYHALLHPNIFNDVNGEYRIFESNTTGHTSGTDRYTVFSLWDTYRCLHPFLSLVYPRQQSAMVKSLLGMADESGFLPKWEYAGVESGVMTGDPSLPVIADTWFRGIHDFDIGKAYKAMKRNATTPGKNNYIRPGIDEWLRYGYIPEDAANVLHPFSKAADAGNNYAGMRQNKLVWGSVSTGLEYCIADWNLAQLARQLGKKDDYHTFSNRAMLYRKSFDRSVGFMRARTMDGKWVKHFDAANNKVDAFTEGASWNYSFMVSHDMPGLIKIMGGQKRFINKLDACFQLQHFDITNEPNLAYPYLYNYVKGAEWKTQKAVRQIIAASFKNTPDGLPGNDDCGTMSAWLVFSMMGLYPDCPGNMDYQLASPTFKKTTILLDSAYYPGKQFVIEVSGNTSDDFLIDSIRFNDKPYKKFQINHGDIIQGGRLAFILKSQ